MKIIKDRTSVGQYVAIYETNDKEVGKLFATGDSQLEALNRMFAKLRWAEIGNWTRKSEKSELTLQEMTGLPVKITK